MACQKEKETSNNPIHRVDANSRIPNEAGQPEADSSPRRDWVAVMITSGLRCANTCFGNRTVTDSRSRGCGQLPLLSYPRGRRASGLLVSVGTLGSFSGRFNLSLISTSIHTPAISAYFKRMVNGGSRVPVHSRTAGLKEFLRSDLSGGLSDFVRVQDEFGSGEFSLLDELVSVVGFFPSGLSS